jgi:hypothetical protein
MTQPATRSQGAHEQTPEELRQAQIERNQAAIALLNSWMEEDEDEQRETFAFLKRALDEDRPSYRKLFEQ